MCGIVGILNIVEAEPPDEQQVRDMLSIIRHRGPDEFGIYIAPKVALGNARLSIIDLVGGRQPITNEDRSLWIVFNGEIFNYIELRSELESRGHKFTTHSDTEVILHLYEESGPACLQQLNGQFAIAIWNEIDHSLFLARDRLGIRPLFYTVKNGIMIFASEIKAIACHPSVKLDIDPIALDQVFTFWSVISPRSIFSNIWEIPPGSYLLASNGQYAVKKYWQMDFPNVELNSADENAVIPESSLLESFQKLLIDAVKIRLRADVPVGAYLSGGLDSSVISYIIRQYGSNRLDTFSIAFDDKTFDESVFQKKMARYLGTDHQVIQAAYQDIGRVFPEVIWHTEVPVLRTAPAPMFLLSHLVRKNGYKVVLTGEGADEFLAGYDIFKEAKIRRFWARQPESKWRSLLFSRLYKDIPRFSQAGADFMAAFFKDGLTDIDSPDYSHAIRWRNARRIKRFFSEELTGKISGSPPGKNNRMEYPDSFETWGPLERSQYLEITTFLSPYLLSSQGDRVAMAHSIEGRYPFLDYRVVEFSNHLPAHVKLRGLTDKYLLRKLAEQWLPSEIWKRPKRPYRAPIHKSFLGEHAPDYINDLLSPTALTVSGLFRTDAVVRLIRKIKQDTVVGEMEDMALTGIISTQLIHHLFVTDFRKPQHSLNKADVKVCRSAMFN